MRAYYQYLSEQPLDNLSLFRGCGNQWHIKLSVFFLKKNTMTF